MRGYFIFLLRCLLSLFSLPQKIPSLSFLLSYYSRSVGSCFRNASLTHRLAMSTLFPLSLIVPFCRFTSPGPSLYAGFGLSLPIREFCQLRLLFLRCRPMGGICTYLMDWTAASSYESLIFPLSAFYGDKVRS